MTKTKLPKPSESKPKQSLSEKACHVFEIVEKGLKGNTGFEKDGLEVMLLPMLDLLMTYTGDVEEAKLKVKSILAAMATLEPQDGYEGLLIAQMISVYKNAMSCFALANNNKDFAEIYFKLQNQGIKLMKLYNLQLETLDKHRRKGNQKMTVEHVHVHKGGQAIVGSVTQEGGGKQ